MHTHSSSAESAMSALFTMKRFKNGGQSIKEEKMGRCVPRKKNRDHETEISMSSFKCRLPAPVFPDWQLMKIVQPHGSHPHSPSATHTQARFVKYHAPLSFRSRLQLLTERVNLRRQRFPLFPFFCVTPLPLFLSFYSPLPPLITSTHLLLLSLFFSPSAPKPSLDPSPVSFPPSSPLCHFARSCHLSSTQLPPTFISKSPPPRFSKFSPSQVFLTRFDVSYPQKWQKSMKWLKCCTNVHWIVCSLQMKCPTGKTENKTLIICAANVHKFYI